MHRPVAPPPKESDKRSKRIALLRKTLLLLILELVFEGLARKMQIKGTNVAIFVVKDLIILLMGVQLLQLKRPRQIDYLWIAYLVEFVLFLPLAWETALHDPILAVFGTKEYLLYPIVAFATFTAFEDAPLAEIISFYRLLALLIIPTTALAVIELHLPADNWLNLSVEGDMLDAFAAGGYLRVSGTFSFVSQFCAFINAEVFIVMIALNNLKDLKMFWKCLYLSLIPMLIVCSYITGSRGAVLVNLIIIGIGAGLCIVRFQARSFFRIIAIVIGLFVTLVVVHTIFPDAFAAYADRERGHLIGASDEIQGRIYDALFGWVGDAFTTPTFGSGLGIMSNGSEVISNYAAYIRARSWTETDFATTLFEGGLYLIIVWFGFRLFVIIQALRHFVETAGDQLTLPAAFCAGYIFTVGLTGTLGIQPPLSIWFWFSVGTALLLWWKSVAPTADKPRPKTPAMPPAPKPIRGRSSYADRLHAEKQARP